MLPRGRLRGLVRMIPGVSLTAANAGVGLLGSSSSSGGYYLQRDTAGVVSCLSDHRRPLLLLWLCSVSVERDCRIECRSGSPGACITASSAICHQGKSWRQLSSIARRASRTGLSARGYLCERAGFVIPAVATLRDSGCKHRPCTLHCFMESRALTPSLTGACSSFTCAPLTCVCTDRVSPAFGNGA